jgi:hypothetical protein
MTQTTMRTRTLRLPAVIDHPIIEQIDVQEHAGDEYSELDGNACVDPGGHLFRTSCGETRCVHCSEIAWS